MWPVGGKHFKYIAKLIGFERALKIKHKLNIK